MSDSTSRFDMLLYGAEVLLQAPDSDTPRLEKADLALRDGKIAAINPSNPDAKEKVDLQGLTVFPGWIDSQVHFREPGLEHKEDLEHGSASAAAGGITAFFEMPNTKPNTTEKSLFEDKIQRALKVSYTDFAFYMGANGENTERLSELEKLPGCCGVKIFMGSSTGTLLIDRLDHLDRILAHLRRRPAIHAEDEDRLKQRKSIAESQPGHVQNHPVWRDETTALMATQNALRLAQKNNRPVHILHVTTAEEMDLLARHKKWASVEVTPQHLSLFAPECYERLGTLAQMNPPIRNEHHQQALWKALTQGVVDVLGSDHAPHTFTEKQGTYPATPSGMPGVQTLPALMLNHVHRGRLSLFRLNELLAVNPVRLWGIPDRGFVHPGYEATFSIFDLNRTEEVTTQWLRSKCGWSPFEGEKLQGWPVHTVIRGQFALRDGELHRVSTRALKFNR